jgi:hypothetical protein
VLILKKIAVSRSAMQLLVNDEALFLAWWKAAAAVRSTAGSP